jgi:hypothetical protein
MKPKRMSRIGCVGNVAEEERQSDTLFSRKISLGPNPNVEADSNTTPKQSTESDPKTSSKRKIPCVTVEEAREIQLGIISMLQKNPRVDHSYFARRFQTTKDLESYKKKCRIHVVGEYFWRNLEKFLKQRSALRGMDFYIVTSLFGQNINVRDPRKVLERHFEFYDPSK